MKSLLLLILTLMSAPALAADLGSIFPAESKVSEPAQAAIKTWFQSNCKDLTWALSVKESPLEFAACERDVQKVSVIVELSHLSSTLTFWMSEKEGVASVDWVHDQWPSWHVCNFPGSFSREDMSCKYLPTDF